ncbi:Ribosomal protein L36e [Giardia duodenalis]|uniref:Ribosomal protein L36e n=2 Tax=Giardia intestinalis TaxID=5741 RepID=A8BYA6_GIAIC|nr:Ribosomal protein L36e [Giardia intestinalis]7PWG_i Chain i, Ribosomal protein L36-1 [Giardia lamblia ATCC 50803]7PWO_i2 Chain i2, Ribosomal protein L36-1 [Giardia lamblia ATCC 50803]8BR8_Lj Chain Lj, Ribosomal protein L36-1 [Giardia lamblia ATCC 50803]8BRM_Lj Chain Lj, Ribosomal protein L36-1 [Giardia lamblia ATCC 50803]8BSI_Lj Chain Lj, Ribosomal protein L36-1 [Giardia intestinalis]8BSJ_Lj Chain Lj, Ribosomal protein L36-1 [Giardia intestinalis]8BTD_Lj Chain Lj, Ribosomal protein L36-1 |eukprot:XP_001704191.1 Ribosomal protein L36-1 [Giardia lamblia ATCC 50803]
MPGKVFNLKKGGAVVRIVRKKEERKTKPHQEFVKSIIQECTGMAPYEMHIIELLRMNKDRHALRYAKKRLGNIKRAKAKRDQLSVYARNI